MQTEKNIFFLSKRFVFPECLFSESVCQAVGFDSVLGDSAGVCLSRMRRSFLCDQRSRSRPARPGNRSFDWLNSGNQSPTIDGE